MKELCLADHKLEHIPFHRSVTLKQIRVSVPTIFPHLDK